MPFVTLDLAATPTPSQAPVMTAVLYSMCAWVVALDNQFYQAAVDVAREMGVSLGDLRHALVVNSCLTSTAPCRQYTTTD